MLGLYGVKMGVSPPGAAMKVLQETGIIDNQ
jgi:hypothetical protein